MRGLVISITLVLSAALLLTSCPGLIKQAKRGVQAAKQIQQGLPTPSSAEKSWHVIASGTRPGFMHSLEVINGCPVVAYSDQHQIYFAQAQKPVPLATEDWLSYDIDPTQEESIFSILTQLGGKPVLIFSEKESKRKILAVAKTSKPQSAEEWERFELPDNRYHPGQAAEIDGRLAIATQRRSTQEERDNKNSKASYSIVFLRQPDASIVDPATWEVSTFPLDESCRVDSLQLMEYQGLPLLAFRAGSGSGVALYLWQAKCADPATLDDWEQTEVAGGPGGEVLDSELGLHAGQPVLAYDLGVPSKLALTLANPRADEPGFDLASFWLTDLGDYGNDIALTSHQGKLLVGWSFWAQVFVFESDGPAPSSKDDFRSYFMSESPGKDTVGECELAVSGGKLVGTYSHEGTPGELRFVVFE